MTRVFISPVNTFGLFIILFASGCCEVVVKETKIDPFTILFEKQNILIDRIYSITDRLQRLEDSRTDDVNIRINGLQVEAKLTQIFSGIVNIEEKFDKLSKEISTIKYLHKKNEEVNLGCSCFSLTDLSNNISSVPSETPSSDENKINENETTMEEIDSIPAIPDIKLAKIMVKYINASTSMQSIIQNIGLTLNSNMEYGINKIMDIVLQRVNTQTQKDNQLLLNQSCDNVAMALLKIINTNQELFEKQLEKNITVELEAIKDTLFSEVVKINNDFSMFKLLFEKILRNNEFINDEALNDTDNDYLVNYEDNGFVVQQNALNDTNSSLFYTLLYVDAVNNQTYTENETLNSHSIDSVLTLLNDTQNLLPLDAHDIIEEKTINNQIRLSGTEDPIRKIKLCRHQNETADETILASILNKSELSSSKVLKEIKYLQTTLSDRMRKVEEQIIGFKIYQSSALHSHMKEVRFELSKVRDEMYKSIAYTGNKINKKLESNKLSLFAYLNAAVTSVTSSTVTSSKATGVALSKTLRNIFQQLQTKLLQMSWFGSVECPGLYQKVGSSCLLAVENMRASWIDSCKFCSSLGGIIPKINKKDLSILKLILGIDTEGVWLKTENSSTNSDNCHEYNSLTFSNENLKKDERVCTAFMTNVTAINDVPCSKKLSVVCQRPNVLRPISKDFNISTVLSELDFFLKNSKYYKFKNNYV